MRIVKGKCLPAIVVGLACLCSCTSGTQAATISGFVFRDLNANGVRDAREPGEPNILVEVYDVNNRFVASATTDVNGDYVINSSLDSSLIVKGESYTVLFSGLPAGVVSGPAGEDSGTEMQFADGGATNVNYGVFNPDQYALPAATPSE